MLILYAKCNYTLDFGHLFLTNVEERRKMRTPQGKILADTLRCRWTPMQCIALWSWTILLPVLLGSDTKCCAPTRRCSTAQYLGKEGDANNPKGKIT